MLRRKRLRRPVRKTQLLLHPGHPHLVQIGVHRNPIPVLEKREQIIFINEKTGCQIVQRDFFPKVLVQIFLHLLDVRRLIRQGILGRICGCFGRIGRIHAEIPERASG